jgi:hypothetical protein
MMKLSTLSGQPEAVSEQTFQRVHDAVFIEGLSRHPESGSGHKF